jgi:hypothetical protein
MRVGSRHQGDSPKLDDLRVARRQCTRAQARHAFSSVTFSSRSLLLLGDRDVGQSFLLAGLLLTVRDCLSSCVCRFVRRALRWCTRAATPGESEDGNGDRVPQIRRDPAEKRAALRHEDLKIGRRATRGRSLKCLFQCGVGVSPSFFFFCGHLVTNFLNTKYSQKNDRVKSTSP